MTERKRSVKEAGGCDHPAERLYAWHAADGALCVCCCKCRTPLHGAAPRTVAEWEREHK
jgi:hypothetical protein